MPRDVVENARCLIGKQSGKANAAAGSNKMADQPEIYKRDPGKEIAKVGPTLHSSGPENHVHVQGYTCSEENTEASNPWLNTGQTGKLPEL